MPQPTVTTPAPLSPTTYTGSGQPTLPPGSIVDTGSGPTVTPNPSGGPTPGDAGLYRRVSDVPPVNPIPNNTTMNNEQQPIKDEAAATAAAQSSVKYVTDTYNKKIQDFTSGQGAANVGRENAIAALSGLSGASGATDREGVATSTNKKTTDVFEQQKQQAISNIYNQLSKIEVAAGAAYNGPAKTDKDGNPEPGTGGQLTQDQNNLKADQQTRAKSVLTSLSTELGNVSFGQFKQADPETYQKILQLAGGDEGELEILYNASMKPTVTKTGATSNPMSQYHFTADGHVYGPSKDGSGDIVERSDLEHLSAAAQENSPSQYGYIAQKMPDGNVYLFPKDAKGKAVYDPSKPLFGGQPLSGANGVPGAPGKKTPAPKAAATSLTKSQYTTLAHAGLDQAAADKITTAIIKGIPLDQIRAALQSDKDKGVSSFGPEALDYYDRTVGIQKILKNSKPAADTSSSSSTSSTPLGL